MIVKSMARKTPSFRQLIEYFHKDQYHRKAPVYSHNLWQAGSPEAAAAEMEQNATFLPKRSNGNYCYHECIILPANDNVSQAKQQRILLDLVERYVQLRAPDQLVYGRMHLDTDHLHFHLAVSANTVRGRQRRWLSKASFGNIQRDLERYKLEKYPELGKTKFYDLEARQAKREARAKTHDADAKLSREEFELKRRTGQLSRKEQERGTILEIFEKAKSERELIKQLRVAGFELYVRGQQEGVRHLDNGRKYRLTTLGLEQSLRTNQRRIQYFAEQAAELDLIRDNRADREISLTREQDR